MSSHLTGVRRRPQPLVRLYFPIHQALGHIFVQAAPDRHCFRGSWLTPSQRFNGHAYPRPSIPTPRVYSGPRSTWPVRLSLQRGGLAFSAGRMRLVLSPGNANHKVQVGVYHNAAKPGRSVMGHGKMRGKLVLYETTRATVVRRRGERMELPLPPPEALSWKSSTGCRIPPRRSSS